MGLLKEEHHLNGGGGLKVRQPLSFMHIKNVSPKTPPNRQKNIS